MATRKRKKYLVFSNGTRKEITGENGKYWISDGITYRKLDSDIIVREEEVSERKEKSNAKEKTHQSDESETPCDAKYAFAEMSDSKNVDGESREKEE